MTEDGKPGGSEHSLNLIAIEFLCECNFYPLVSLPNIRRKSHFQKIC